MGIPEQTYPICLGKCSFWYLCTYVRILLFLSINYATTTVQRDDAMDPQQAICLVRQLARRGGGGLLPLRRLTLAQEQHLLRRTRRRVL